jgi:hypothetical protein
MRHTTIISYPRQRQGAFVEALVILTIRAANDHKREWRSRERLSPMRTTDGPGDSRRCAICLHCWNRILAVGQRKCIGIDENASGRIKHEPDRGKGIEQAPKPPATPTGVLLRSTQRGKGARGIYPLTRAD